MIDPFWQDAGGLGKGKEPFVCLAQKIQYPFGECRVGYRAAQISGLQTACLHHGGGKVRIARDMNQRPFGKIGDFCARDHGWQPILKLWPRQWRDEEANVKAVLMSGSILILDGSATHRISLKVRIAAASHDVTTARTLDEAVGIMQHQPISLVIVGVDTGEAGPNLAVARLCAEGRDLVPVLAMTRPHQRMSALRSGAAAVLDTDITDDELLARIRSFVRDAPLFDTIVDLAPSGHMASITPFGMAEAPTAFAPARRTAVHHPKVAVITSTPQQAILWRGLLQRAGGLKTEISDTPRLLTICDGSGPDVLIIDAASMWPLLADIKSRENTRNMAVCVITPATEPELISMALNLGAADAMTDALMNDAGAAEVMARVDILMRRKAVADRHRRAFQNARKLALTDELTGLPNRRHAMAYLSTLVSSTDAADRPLTVLALDIDRFKRVNDRFGHATGDAVLAAVAGAIKLALPTTAFAARLGGEEFVVVLPGYPVSAGAQIADKLRAVVAALTIPVRSVAGSVQITVSVGVASQSRDSATRLDAQLLLDRADRAMLTAKAKGRNLTRCEPLPTAA
ncbi:MAG: hypothetical protein DI498_08825 [Paracoccus denitrificans]|nr:MAG: hypothetical protein DI498_08825 [Paracoccus denitrificans]PZO84161.1 MAG: hypothetical protein DI633_08825 [Paracoccus denitrificans]